MAKDAYYFSHDSNAHKDPKILKLRMKYGWEGYGIYWAIIETLREQKGYKWLSNDKELLCYSIANGEPIICQVADYCIEIGLLVDDGEYIYSDSFLKRMSVYENKRKKKVEAGRKGAEKRWGNDDSKQPNGSANSGANGKVMAKNGKGKESKVKESKVKNDKKKHLDHVQLTDGEYNRLIDEYGKQVIDSKIEDLDTYISNKGKNPYKDHNKTLRNWIKRDGIKSKSETKKEEEPTIQEMIDSIDDSLSLGLEYFKGTKQMDRYKELQEAREKLEQQL